MNIYYEKTRKGEESMKKMRKKAMAALLSFVMVASVVFTYLPSLQTLAAPTKKTMAHLVAGESNGNGHFGGATPEAFVLSNKNDITSDSFSFTMKLGDKDGARFRFVNKYVDDTHWSYIAYDGMRTGDPYWFAEYKDGTSGYWPDITGLPVVQTGDVITLSGEYTDTGLKITLENKTKGTSGTGIITDSGFLSLKDSEGKIGYGAGYRNVNAEQKTEFYFADTKVGTENLGFNDFTPYEKSASGYTWEEVDGVVIGDDGLTEEVVESRKWFVLQGGSNNGGGHNYGDGSAKGPLFYTDTDKTMESSGTISLALKPSSNWGVFYNYIDDSNWLYVGYDSSSKWYYQYKWNGSENYPQISGLPDPVEGEELSLTISLTNETLTVTVNGTTAYATNQTLKDYAAALTEDNGNMGKFGVMTKGATKISFADFKYNNEDCMKDTWAFNAVREGQTMTEETTAVEVVRGTVKAASNNSAIEGATVRVGTKSATTNAKGEFAIANVQVGDYVLAVSKPGYQAYTQNITVEEGGNNTFDVALVRKADLNLEDYDTIESDDMTVYVGKEFPVVVRYVMKSDATGKTFFRANETDLKSVVINGHSIVPTVTVKETKAASKTYALNVVDEANNIDLDMDVKISVEANTLTWEVIKLTKNEGCDKIATIDIPELNLLTVDASEEESVFAGAQVSTTTTSKADTYISFDDGFVPSDEDGYLYAFLSNGKLSAGLHSNSEKEGDKRVERINGADSMSLTSAVWYYECGDSTGQAQASRYDYQVSELPQAKVAIAGDLNNDTTVDWNDGAIAFRDIMHYAQGSESVKDMVNHRIVMNFESAAPNPFLVTADNIKKVYLATDGLPQAIVLKGYGNEGHDSANSEYADIAEREGGVKDFQNLIKIAHKYNTQIGIHVNAQEAYPEARSFNEIMVGRPGGGLNGNGWGWLDQSVVINKLWDLSSDARLKRFAQLYDRINGTNFYSGDWEKGEYVKDSQGILTNGDGVTEVSRTEFLELIKADAANRPNNMDLIYLDVWYQDAWETRRIAEEINSLGWRFSTEFSAEGEYDSTWQHWSTDAKYGGAGAKGLNSDIIRFLRNDQRDSQVLNHPEFGGTADNPLLGGYRLYGFEGWGGDQNFNNYIYQTFNQNLPTRFLQHYQVTKWVNYEAGKSPVGNTEKEITLSNGTDTVVVTRNEEQRNDTEIERTITLNGKVVLNTDVDGSAYLLPWTDNDDGSEKLYHWNLDGGSTTWDLQDDWAKLGTVYVYELSDQGRINKEEVSVAGGKVTLEAKAGTAYVVVKGAEVKELQDDFGECDFVVDPGFNGYTDGAKLDAADWSGDINAEGVAIAVSKFGDQKLVMTNTTKDVSVSTTISGLTKGEHYVAEIYVENLSDAKAAITVDAGKEEVSAYTYRSIVTNTISCDSEHGTKMQRIQVAFVAEGDTATFTLSREAGEGTTTWDDIRIVERETDNFKADGSFEQDFESVVQSLYPFVLTYNAGGDSRTHLSQLNAPYTQKGWNGKSVDDVIDGEWSLKHHTNITGIVYQTIPQNFRFEAGKVYKVEFDYQTVSAGYQMVVGDGTTYTRPTVYLPTTEKTEHVSMQVVGNGSGQTWIGLYMNGSLCGSDTSIGNVDFILDNLKITEEKDVVVATIDNTSLYKGETANIFGSGLEKIRWEIITEGDEEVEEVVRLDLEENKIYAIGAGTATLRAFYSENHGEDFVITVTDKEMVDFEEDELGEMSAEANNANPAVGTEGPARFAVDGDSGTFWHTNYTPSQDLIVSESNPAILTVDLGNVMTISGFKFQQRPATNNGVVQRYKYAVSEDGTTYSEWSDIKTTANPAGGAWETAAFAQDVDAKYIKIAVVQGQGNFAAIAEVLPVKAIRVAEAKDITLEDVTVNEDGTITLVPQHPENTVVKGLVWESSDPSIATVDAYGNVIGLKAGTVTITLRNALGVLTACTVTVNGTSEPPVDPDDPNPPVDPDDPKPPVDPEKDTTAPAAPTSVKTSDIKNDSVKISWKAATDNVGVAGYVIFVNGVEIGKVTDTTATIENLVAGTKYEIEIRAYDEAGNQSKGTTITVTTKGTADSSNKPSGKPGISAPTTGDAAPITFIVMLMAAAMAVVVVIQKKRVRR